MSKCTIRKSLDLNLQRILVGAVIVLVSRLKALEHVEARVRLNLKAEFCKKDSWSSPSPRYGNHSTVTLRRVTGKENKGGVVGELEKVGGKGG